MSPFLLVLVLCVVLVVAGRQYRTINYYFHLLASGFLIQIGLVLPYFYFPFRPFDYRNANASASFAIAVGKFLGLRYNLTGIEHLRAGGGIVLINHQSFLDLVVLGYLWRHLGPCAVIAKKEILYFMPPIGLSIWSYGSIFIDRSNRKAAMRSIEAASRAIREQNKKLIFFPEGTRSVSDDLLPFKKGAFVSAFENKCNIFPVVVSKFKYLDHQRREFNPCEGTISILEAVDANCFENSGDLLEHCQIVMQKEYDRLNAAERGEGGGTERNWDHIWRFSPK